MSDSNPLPDTVGDLLGEGDQGGPDSTPEGFDPTKLPGSEVIFDDGDVTVVAVPLNSVPDGSPGPVDFGDLIDALAGGPADGTGMLTEVISLLSVQHRHMEWAAEELVMARRRHGLPDPGEDGEDVFSRTFPYLACVDQPYMAPEQIFRAHCVELLDRAAVGKALEPATDAEVLGLLVDRTQQGEDLCEGFAALYYRLAHQLLPDLFEELRTDYLAQMIPGFDLDTYVAERKEESDHHERELREILTRDRSPLNRPRT